MENKGESGNFNELGESSKLVGFHNVSAVILNSGEIELNFIHYSEVESWMKVRVNKILGDYEFRRLIEGSDEHRTKFAELMLKGENPEDLYKKK